jgi:hypothetical protein
VRNIVVMDCFWDMVYIHFVVPVKYQYQRIVCTFILSF